MLQTLDLSDTPRITDAGLLHLRTLTGLTHLNLNGTRISDAGFVHIAGLSNLQNLWLDHTALSDSVLSNLSFLDKRHCSLLRERASRTLGCAVSTA